jgi:hypothetical protein
MANSLAKKAYLSLTFIGYLINKSRIKISYWDKKIFCKRNYKVVLIIESLLHQSIVPKIFMINALLKLDIN